LWNTNPNIQLQPFTPIIVKLGKLKEYNDTYCIDVSEGDLILTDAVEHEMGKSLMEWFKTASSDDLKILTN
jgi:hypothetical protein